MNHPVFEKVKTTSNVELEFFKGLFKNASKTVLDTIQIINVPENNRFITVDDNVDKVLILLYGKVKAVEEYLTGDIYVFSKFEDPEIFGELEALGGFDKFRASLVTETPAVLAVLPVSSYMQLLREDTKLFFERVKLVVQRSSIDVKENRYFLRLKALDRIKIYMLRHYEQSQKSGIAIIRVTRQQMADETGYSIKTINRAIKSLLDDKLIILIGHKIRITKAQALRIREDLEYINEIKK